MGLYAEPDPGALLVTGWPHRPVGFRDVPMMAVTCAPLGSGYWVGCYQFDGNRPPRAYDMYGGGSYLVELNDEFNGGTESAVAHGLVAAR